MSVRRLVALDDDLPSHAGRPPPPRLTPTAAHMVQETLPALPPRLPLLSTSLRRIVSKNAVTSGEGHRCGDGGLPLPPLSRLALPPPLSVALLPLGRERGRLHTPACGQRQSPLPPPLKGSTGGGDSRDGGCGGGSDNGEHTPARPAFESVGSEAIRVPTGPPWSCPDRRKASILTAADNGNVPMAAGAKGPRASVSHPGALRSMRSASCSGFTSGVTKAAASMSATTVVGEAAADTVAEMATSWPPQRELLRSSPPLHQTPRSSPSRSSPPFHRQFQCSPPTDPAPRLSPPPSRPLSLQPLFDRTARDERGGCGGSQQLSRAMRAVLDPYNPSVAGTQPAAQVYDGGATGGDATGGAEARLRSDTTAIETVDCRSGSGSEGGSGPFRPSTANPFSYGSQRDPDGSGFGRDGEDKRHHHGVNTTDASTNLPAFALPPLAQLSNPDVPTTQLLGLTVASTPSPDHVSLLVGGDAADGRDNLPPSAASEFVWTLPRETAGSSTGVASQTFTFGDGSQGRRSGGSDSVITSGRERAHTSVVSVSPPQGSWTEQPSHEFQSGPTRGTMFATLVREVDAGAPQCGKPQRTHPSPSGHNSGEGERVCPRPSPSLVYSGGCDDGSGGSPDGPALAGYTVADGGWRAREGARLRSGYSSVEPLLPLLAGSDEQPGGIVAAQFPHFVDPLQSETHRGVHPFYRSYATDLRASPEEAGSAALHAPVLPALRFDRGVGSPEAAAALDRANLRASPGPSRGGASSMSPTTTGTTSTLTPCGTCGANFTSRCHLNIHIKTVHWGLRPWLCSTCGVSFGQKGTLTRHRSAVHAKRRPHRCGRCSKAFGERWTLRVHVRNVHDRERPHECELCNKRFGTLWRVISGDGRVRGHGC